MGEFDKIRKKRKKAYRSSIVILGLFDVLMLAMCGALLVQGVKEGGGILGALLEFAFMGWLPLAFFALCIWLFYKAVQNYRNSDGELRKVMETIGAHSAEECDMMLGTMENPDEGIYMDRRYMLNLMEVLAVDTEDITDAKIVKEAHRRSGGKHHHSRKYYMYVLVLQMYDGSEVVLKKYSKETECQRVLARVRTYIRKSGADSYGMTEDRYE